jgi:hypothetical protein
MKTPYSDLPDTAFWRRSVATPAAGEVDPVGPVPFQISASDQVMTAGSCFAQHIARYMRHCGLDPMVTEPPHPLLSPAQATRWNYGSFTARYGNIYVARQLLQLLQRAYGHFSPKEDLWRAADGSLLDPFRPQIQPGGFASQAEFTRDRQQHFAAVRRAFERCDVFIFTLGLTEAWISRQDGAVFALCPGTAGGTYDPDRHVFHNFSVTETLSDMNSFLAALRQVNPKVRVILTVSPVPLIASASGRPVLQATTYSKSVLRVAAEMLMAQHQGLFYFPSYEIITGPQARGAYLAEDLRSVRENGVAHVMRLFLRHLCGLEVPDTLPDTLAEADAPPAPLVGDAATRAATRVVRVACEEEMLDPPSLEGGIPPKPVKPLRHRVVSDPPGFIDQHAQAQVTPLSRYGEPRFDPDTGQMAEGHFDGGLYDGAGQLISDGDNRFLNHMHQPAPQVDPSAAVAKLSGRYLFAGLMHNLHFGHFLTEGISRLWGLDHVDRIDGILCQHLFPNQPLADFAVDLFALFAPGIPLLPITGQTQVETLLLPQALRFPLGVVRGHPLNRVFFAEAAQRAAAQQQSSPPQPGPDKIFVSRAALPLAGARFVLEEALDANFAALGYQVIHPENLSVSDQMRLYGGASHLVFSEGSALHLYALMARPDQQVYCIWRRQVMHPIFNRQLESFGGGPLLGGNHVQAMLPRRQFPTVMARAASLLDFAALGQDLAARGFINADDPWPSPRAKALRRGLRQLKSQFHTSAADACLPQPVRRFLRFK